MVLRSNYVAFFHLVVIFHHSIAVLYDFMHIAPKELQLRKFSFGGRFIYLYVWNMFLQLIYFIMAFINDFIEAKDIKQNHLTKFTIIKDYIFSSFVFPVASDVSVMFWVFYFINSNLVISRELYELVPTWFSHMLRTNIMIFVVLEICWTYRKYPCHFCGIFGVISFIVAYIAWTFFVYFNTDEWVYPVLEKFTWPQRIGFFGFSIFVPITFYFVGELLNNIMWRSKNKKSKNKEHSSHSDMSEPSSKIIRITEV